MASPYQRVEWPWPWAVRREPVGEDVGKVWAPCLKWCHVLCCNWIRAMRSHGVLLNPDVTCSVKRYEDIGETASRCHTDQTQDCQFHGEVIGMVEKMIKVWLPDADNPLPPCMWLKVWILAPEDLQHWLHRTKALTPEDLHKALNL